MVLIIFLVCLLIEGGVSREAGGQGGGLRPAPGPQHPVATPALTLHSQDVHDDANGPAVHRPPVPLPTHHLRSCEGQESGPAHGPQLPSPSHWGDGEWEGPTGSTQDWAPG